MHPACILSAQVDRFGRRPLLFVGITMMLLSLVTLSLTFRQPAPGSEAPSGPWSLLIVVALIVYVCGYQARLAECALRNGGVDLQTRSRGAPPTPPTPPFTRDASHAIRSGLAPSLG